MDGREKLECERYSNHNVEKYFVRSKCTTSYVAAFSTYRWMEVLRGCKFVKFIASLGCKFSNCNYNTEVGDIVIFKKHFFHFLTTVT